MGIACRSNELVLRLVLSVLDCVIFIFGHSDPYFMRYNNEYESPVATIITHPAGKNLRLACASGKLLQYNAQDYYIAWNLKTCAGTSAIPCSIAVRNPGVPVCSKQMLHPCRKKLTIHKPKLNDSGIYSCSIHKNNAPEFHLIISMFQVEFIGRIRNPPQLLGDEPKNKSVAITQQVGLECRVSSLFPPTSIKWVRRINIKNLTFTNYSTNIILYNNYTYLVVQGNKITDPYYVKQAGPFANGVYLSKLIIKSAEPYHTGFYACVAINTVGIKYQEMYLTVMPLTAIKGKQRRPPELLSGQPKNVSIIVPQTAILECRVRSQLPPVVRWLRRIDQLSFRTPHLSSPVSIEYINNSYQMLTWNYSEGGYCKYYIDEGGPLYNDIYISKLIFPVTTVFDTGFYACVVMNDMGIVYREIFLNAMSTFLIKDDSFAWASTMVLIIVPVLLTLAIVITCYQKLKQNIMLDNQENQHYVRPQIYFHHYNGSKLFQPAIACKGVGKY